MKEAAKTMAFVRNGWGERYRPESRCMFENALEMMLTGWFMYGVAHRATYESTIGDDGVLGPCWAEIGHALLGLLNGVTGGLDCARVDGWIRWRMEEAGTPAAD